MNLANVEKTATALFALALLHTFCAAFFTRISRQIEDKMLAKVFHLLGEVELVFGLWSAIFIACFYFIDGSENAAAYLDHLDFTEPLFVFVIMCIASTKPILETAHKIIDLLAQLLPLSKPIAFLFVSLTAGPLLGSLITEPAAMTVTALLLRDAYFANETLSKRTRYILLATLFVNVSIGGVLTPFAAPPVIMVARHWNWDAAFMFTHFGWKAALAVVVNALIALGATYQDIHKCSAAHPKSDLAACPWWLLIAHFVFFIAVVRTSHHAVLFFSAFLFFLGVKEIAFRYHDALRLRESFFVAFFLAGLIVLGTPQAWWLRPLLVSAEPFPLFTLTTLLTGFVDNAALTYLGSQVQGLSPLAQYFLVAGAVTGGGLTIIANAPNPAGASLLKSTFGRNGIEPVWLFLAGLAPTLVAFSAFWFL